MVALVLFALAVTSPRWLPLRDTGEWVPVNERFAACGAGDRNGSRACVVDGDTVRIGSRRIRFTGFDAPELAGACAAETAKAREASGALRAWLARGPFVWDGGGDPPRDEHGRELRTARRGQEWLADVMVERELAEGSGWDRVRVDWCEV